MVPSFSYDFAIEPPPYLRVPRNGINYDGPYPGSTAGTHRIYTPAVNEIDPNMGAIAAAVVQHPARVRGAHPLNSFSAVGPLAARLIAGQAPLAVYAPLRTLVEVRGFVLLMGVEVDSMTLLHLAEEEGGRVPFRRWANDAAGHPQMVQAGSCSDGFGRLAPVLQPWQRQTVAGASMWRLYPAGPALQASAAVIRANPQITHCGNPECERCRDAMLGGPILA